MAKRSFASMLTWKIVILTSAIFIITISLVAIFGSRIAYNKSLKYSIEKLNTSVAEIESVMNSIEYSTVGIGRTFESFYRSDQYLDSASIFQLFQKTIDENPFFIGIGVYFEPNVIKGNTRCGIYSWHDHETGNKGNEFYNDRTRDNDNNWDYFSLEWYAKCRESNRRYWTSPHWEMIATYKGEELNKIVSAFSFPLRDKDEKVVGVCSCDLEMSWIKEKLNEMKPFSKSFVFITDDSLNYVCNPGLDNPYSGSLKDEPIFETFDWKDGNWEQIGTVSIVRLDNYGFPAFITSKQMKNGWWVGIVNYNNDVFADMHKMMLALIGIAILGLTAICIAVRRLSRKVSKPIVSFAGVANKITEGNFNVPVPEINSKDEIDELGKALKYMQNSITEYIEELKRTTSEKERLASELNVARTIQMQMLVNNFPEIKSCRIFAKSTPAKEVGGDLYDFFTTENELYFIIGDVSGKGVPAALLMAISIAAFRAAGKNGESVAEILSLINNTFQKSNRDMMFVTATIGKIDIKSGKLTFCNAGHNPMMLIHPNGVAEYIKERPNIACGIVPDFSFVQEELQLEDGSRLILYTDGVTEAEDFEHNQYEEERLLQWGSANGMASVKDDETAVNNLIESLRTFTRGAEQNDDITIASISYTKE